MNKKLIRIAMLSTGEEVLQGDITDTNAAWLGRTFFAAGFQVHRRVTVGDQKENILNELLIASQQSDVVIVNGGLGPTTDDVTTEAMALAMQVELELNQDWLSKIKYFFSRAGREMSASNIKQAMLPTGAKMIPNAIGTACGFSAVLNQTLFFFTPGVPREFKKMVQDEILPRLKEQFKQVEQRQVFRLYSFGLSESSLNEKLSQLALPENCNLGYRSDVPFIEVKLFAPKKQNLSSLVEQICAVMGENLVGVQKPMLSHVAELLLQHQQHVSVIDSFTMGVFSAWLNQDESMQQHLARSLILPNVQSQNENRAKNMKPLRFALDLALKAKSQGKAGIGLACVAMAKDRVQLAMVSSSNKLACDIAFTRELALQEQQLIISAFMLDMVRRHLAKQSQLPSFSSIKVLNTFSD